MVVHVVTGGLVVYLLVRFVWFLVLFIVSLRVYLFSFELLGAGGDHEGVCFGFTGVLLVCYLLFCYLVTFVCILFAGEVLVLLCLLVVCWLREFACEMWCVNVVDLGFCLF